MKFFVVLFAVVAAASAGLIGYHHEPIVQPWVAPAVHAAPVVHEALPWVAAAPKYVKVAAPVSYGKEYHQVLNIPQHVPIPPPHPKPLHLKAHDHVNRIHYDAPHIPHPHLVGVEHYVPAPEPAISVVKAHGHGWD